MVISFIDPYGDSGGPVEDLTGALHSNFWRGGSGGRV